MTLPAEEDPLGVRADFPITRNMTFLATSWIGPMPQVVRDVAVEYVDDKDAVGRYAPSIREKRDDAYRVLPSSSAPSPRRWRFSLGRATPRTSSPAASI